MSYGHIKNCRCSDCQGGRVRMFKIRPGPWWMQEEYDYLPAMRYNLHTNLSKLQRLVWGDEFMRHQHILAFIGTETVQTKSGPLQRKKYEWRRVKIDDPRIIAAA